MSTPRFEPSAYEHFCCWFHSDVCGLEDWCCDACPEAGLVAVPANRRGTFGRIAHFTPPKFPDRASTDEDGNVVWVDFDDAPPRRRRPLDGAVITDVAGNVLWQDER